MSPTINVAIHWSQFPERARRELQESIRRRRLNHKFLYESPSQTRKWLALHEACSPARTDPDCVATYDRSFEGALAQVPAGPVHLVGLGCGGGQKDARLLEVLARTQRPAIYTPVDVGTAMVLTACQAAQAVLPAENCFPLVCDLALADDLEPELKKRERLPSVRLITFFGMIPNFEPGLILPRLAGLMRPGDWLLFSANLAPGVDYAAGVRQVLPLYENAFTRDWLFGFLQELGVENGDGELRFGIEPDPESGLSKIAAHFHFARTRTIEVEGQPFEFQTGASLQVFFSYRHTPSRIRELLARQGLQVLDEWITRSGEEGVFLVMTKSE